MFNCFQVLFLPVSLTGLKYPTDIKEIEMVVSRRKNWGAIYYREYFLKEVSNRSHTDFYCENLVYKVTRMKVLYKVM